MNEEGGGMILGNCLRCAGSLWQSKRRGEPMFCDPCCAKVFEETVPARPAKGKK